ncbi:MAG: ROK family protein [Actinomycetota bacterium]
MSPAHPTTPTSAVLAISVESGRLAAGLVADDGTVLVRDRVATPARDVWRSLDRLIRRLLAATPTGVEVADIAAASVVGWVDAASGSVTPPHIPSWTGFPLRERLEEATGRRVVLDGAGAAAAEFERWIGEARRTRSYVAILADAVVESAAVLDTIRLSGSHGNAGSVAHITVDPGGRQCWCGSLGCLDPYLSSMAIEAEIGRSIRQATPSIVERAGIMLGRAIASMAAMLDVDRFYVSGGVIDVFGDALLDTCRDEIRLRSKLGPLAGLQVIEPVEHVSPIVAAAALVMSR